MDRNTVFVGLALIAASGLAFAQASAPTTRAEVKGEVRAATAQGKPTAATEGPPQVNPQGVAPPAATKTRAERKVEPRAARKTGDLQPAGEGSTAAAPAGSSPTSL